MVSALRVGHLTNTSIGTELTIADEVCMSEIYSLLLRLQILSRWKEECWTNQEHMEWREKETSGEHAYHSDHKETGTKYTEIIQKERELGTNESSLFSAIGCPKGKQKTVERLIIYVCMRHDYYLLRKRLGVDFCSMICNIRRIPYLHLYCILYCTPWPLIRSHITAPSPYS